MRNLLLLRGAPASGKSTWIANNNLQQYTLSADGIRLLWQTPILKADGTLAISQNNDGDVWALLFHLLEQKMRRGELCIVDATHYKSELISRYKKLTNRYRYRIHIVDFTGVPLDELKRRNSLRPQHMVVPEDVLNKMYTVFTMESQIKQLKKSYDVRTPDEAIKLLNDQELMVDWSNWEKIVVFGDIHGCYEPLRSYFERNPISPTTKYVFTGDYLDRGIQNREIIQFCLEHYTKPNFYFLTGNHERWLERYAFKEDQISIPPQIEKLRDFLPAYITRGLQYSSKHSQEFDTKTKPQLEGIPLEDLRQFCRKLGQIAYFKYHDKVYTITHGGISNVPSLRIATSQYISGVGKYPDVDIVHEAWRKNTPANYIQIHGHRNIFSAPIEHSERCYNLCDNIEFGGNLRLMEITQDGIKTEMIQNTIFSEELTVSREADNAPVELDNETILAQLKKSKDIRRRELPNNITSYNFSNRVFEKAAWNAFNVKARGLFLRNETVVARGYDKFFNIGECPQTQWASLQNTLQFPVSVYQKENGFLGLMSWDPESKELLIASKSTTEGDFAQIFRSIWESYPKETQEAITQYLQTHNETILWEVIDPEKDPHIVKYGTKQIVLLDIVENRLQNFSIKSYVELVELANKWHVPIKKCARTIGSYEELKFFISQIAQNNEMQIEGFVIRDTNNFQVKFKTPYYRFWKKMRSIKDCVVRGGEVRQSFVNARETETVLAIRALGAETLKGMDIIKVRELLEKAD